MSTIKPITLYISYSWYHQNLFPFLLNRLAEEAELSLQPIYFANKERYRQIDDRELYRLVRDKVKRCDVVIILSDVYVQTQYNRWMNKEIISAKGEFNKPILAVKMDMTLPVSFVVNQQSDMIMEWDVIRMRYEIERLIRK